MTKLMPYGKRFLVELTKEEEKTEGGILIPSSAKKKYITGKIIEPVAYTNEDNEILEQGDTVLFSEYAGIPVDNDMVIISASEVIGYAK